MELLKLELEQKEKELQMHTVRAVRAVEVDHIIVSLENLVHKK